MTPRDWMMSWVTRITHTSGSRSACVEHLQEGAGLLVATPATKPRIPAPRFVVLKMLSTARARTVGSMMCLTSCIAAIPRPATVVVAHTQVSDYSHKRQRQSKKDKIMASFGSTTTTASPSPAGGNRTMAATDIALPSAGNDSTSSLSWSPTANILVASNWDAGIRCWEVQQQGAQMAATPKAQGTSRVVVELLRFLPQPPAPPCVSPKRGPLSSGDRDAKLTHSLSPFSPCSRFDVSTHKTHKQSITRAARPSWTPAFHPTARRSLAWAATRPCACGSSAARRPRTECRHKLAPTMRPSRRWAFSSPPIWS
jgi:hypothetical protein